MAKLVDAWDLSSHDLKGHLGSSPSSPTNKILFYPTVVDVVTTTDWKSGETCSIQVGGTRN